ncbi:hypothetical protein [Nocardia cyriacigeorgica]|uniref:hypothetical protein n=1 Tax=Nocardia cyriacigeorgica TaxID=135487 RepID=UPI0018949A69|nr:hypothetical protein [Nocardia cyriacigeorgica]
MDGSAGAEESDWDGQSLGAGAIHPVPLTCARRRRGDRRIPGNCLRVVPAYRIPMG